MITTERALFAKEGDQLSEDFDCLVCEFTTPINEGLLSRNGWYNVNLDLSETRTPEPDLVCAIGYPGFRNAINHDDMQYGISPNAVYGTQVLPAIKGRLSFEPINPLEYEPSGLSGSPVFGISTASLEPKAFLAGIVTEASKTRFHFLSLLRIRRYFENLLNEPS